MSVLIGGVKGVVDKGINVKSGQEKYNVKLGIHKWKFYPEYKESGVEWIGEIPKEWGVKKLKYEYSITMGQSPSSEDYNNIEIGLPFLQGNADFQELNPKPTIWCSSATKIAEINDILLSVRAPIGAVNISDQKYGIGRGLCAIKTSYSSYKYMFYLSICLKDEFNSMGTGTTYAAISTDNVKNIQIPIPQINEANNIANFLDRETFKINTLIKNKQLFIGLLEEKRSSLISRTVTKGLDPDIKMKDSEVEWIGEIPENWNAIKIKRLCQVKRGASPRPIDNPIYFDDDGEYSWVRISDVTASNKYLLVTEQTLSFLGQSKSVCLEPGSLFLSIAGSVGKPIIAKIKCCIHDGFVYFEGLKQNSEYLFYLFSCGEMYKGLGKLGTQLNLNTDTIGDIRIPVPSLKEQEEIVNFLDRETEKIGTLINKISAQIEKLKEYRTALISAAVTGKIDVREEVV
jgi:type I restriction enzyme S subunit